MRGCSCTCWTYCFNVRLTNVSEIKSPGDSTRALDLPPPLCAVSGSGGHGLDCSVFAGPSSGKKEEPWPGECGYCVAPTPTRALPTALPIGGHCGGDRSLLRWRAVVARTKWRGAVVYSAWVYLSCVERGGTFRRQERAPPRPLRDRRDLGDARGADVKRTAHSCALEHPLPWPAFQRVGR